MEITNGTIIDWQEDGSVLIKAPLPDLDRAILRQYETVAIGFDDGRRISGEQRRKIYAMLSEISEWCTGSREAGALQTVKEQMKLEFITRRQQALAMKMFSLSDTDVTTAREFISYLIDFMIEWEVPSSRPLIEYCEDIQRFVYACLMKKVCCVCGRPGADLHHVIALGMGRDRKTVNHLGIPCLPLCREHHTESHNIGQQTFMERYHLEPVKIDEQIAKKYRLNTKGDKDG